MKCQAFIIALLFSLVPLSEVYGFNKVKTADDYLDEAELIIKDGTYLPLLENKRGEKDKFLQLTAIIFLYIYLGSERC